MRDSVGNQIAFYASTRTYRKVMELHGWGDICDRLHQYSVGGKWDNMQEEISDEILDEFVVEESWKTLGRRLEDRYGAMVDRIRLYLPFDGSPNWKKSLEGLGR